MAAVKRPVLASEKRSERTSAPREPAGRTDAPAELAGKRRVLIEGVVPQVDGGLHPIKRTVGEKVRVEADVYADGHDKVFAMLLWRRLEDRTWHEAPMTLIHSDRWWASFEVSELGRYRYTVRAWIDPFGTWRRDLQKRIAADQDIAIDLRIGADLIRRAAKDAGGHSEPTASGKTLADWARTLENEAAPQRQRSLSALSEELAEVMTYLGRQHHPVELGRELEVWVETERSRFSAWYEMFPRSAGPAGQHGTFADVEKRLPYVAGMGFDVLYFPPIHPVGTAHRKGRNNSVTAQPGDVGSPWAIGSEEGGHKAIHPLLGSAEQFRGLVKAARDKGIEVALDIAFQVSPDHPYVKQHPTWFRQRPDGTIQYAENPPKKYQDIYPFDFESEDWESMWKELTSIFTHWIDQGVKVFRVDNPHTKSIPFWKYCIDTIKREHPDVIFLAEAFTRPRVMEGLAKVGFTQSYTYFPWRTEKAELREYFEYLTQTPVCEYFRGNHWPNTPDILNEFLVDGGRPAFMQRFVLASTLSASYGIYGPAFELSENRPVKPGSEEYLDSEKYQLRHWDLDRADSLRPLITRINKARRDNSALQQDRTLRFHDSDGDHLLCYSKTSGDGDSTVHDNVVLVVVNLDPHNVHSGFVHLDLEVLGIAAGEQFGVHDLLSGQRYTWSGPDNYVQLDPSAAPAHVFRVTRDQP